MNYRKCSKLRILHLAGGTFLPSAASCLSPCPLWGHPEPPLSAIVVTKAASGCMAQPLGSGLQSGMEFGVCSSPWRLTKQKCSNAQISREQDILAGVHCTTNRKHHELLAASHFVSPAYRVPDRFEHGTKDKPKLSCTWLKFSVWHREGVLQIKPLEGDTGEVPEVPLQSSCAQK
jgi:hypothetical protein